VFAFLFIDNVKDIVGIVGFIPIWEFGNIFLSNQHYLRLTAAHRIVLAADLIGYDVVHAFAFEFTFGIFDNILRFG
jgi:hypothetical protein